MRLPYWSKPCRAQWRCGRLTALPIRAPVPAPTTPPAMAPPALPPETADPISARVPAPIAPPAAATSGTRTRPSRRPEAASRLDPAVNHAGIFDLSGGRQALQVAETAL